jgi:hypothetical protein
MSIITETQLPPKDGYVEIEEDGIRKYVKVESEEMRILRAQLKASNDRMGFLEECLIDMSYEVYKDPSV